MVLFVVNILDNFISGIGLSGLKKGIVYLSCSFNGVDAKFENCTFIDCDNAPKGVLCKHITLRHDTRLIVERRVVIGNQTEWKKV